MKSGNKNSPNLRRIKNENTTSADFPSVTFSCVVTNGALTFFSKLRHLYFREYKKCRQNFAYYQKSNYFAIQDFQKLLKLYSIIKWASVEPNNFRIDIGNQITPCFV